jgi:DMSO/TMAO reductase YedYZ molybdopterin-dependent catalytic subunit
MTNANLNRRDALKATAVAGVASWATWSFPAYVDANTAADEELVPFLGMPRTPPNRLDWEMLEDWLTPVDQVYNVQHYGIPEVDPKEYRLDIGGLVDKPKTLTLDELKSLPQKKLLATFECGGNGASKGFMNAVHNSEWVGTDLADLVKSCGIRDGAIEVAFIGYDKQEETLRKGSNRELSFEVPFGRSLSLADAMELGALVAYQRNGEPLESRIGSPVRLVVPGWYGVANVKWLRRIEVRDRRYMGRFMARDYVTVRGERDGDQVEFVETSVSRMHVKSVVARIMRGAEIDGKVPLKAYGAVWSDGTPIKKVEVKVDDGEWKAAQLAEDPQSKFSWTFFALDLGAVAPGKHTVVSRGIDEKGNIQPSADDDEIALKKTFWEAYQQWPREIEV